MSTTPSPHRVLRDVLGKRRTPYVKIEMVGSGYEAFSNDYPHVFAQWVPGTHNVHWYTAGLEAEPFATTRIRVLRADGLVSLDEFKRYVRRKGLWDQVHELSEGRGRAGL